MKFSFGNKPDNPDLILLLDIGHLSVGAAIVSLGVEGKPKFHYTARQILSQSRTLDSDQLFKMVTQATDEILLKILHDGLTHLNFTGLRVRRFEQAICTLRPPWFLSKTKQVSLKSEKPLGLSEGMLQKILEAEEREFEEKSAERIQAGQTEKFAVLEHQILSIKANGYAVEPHPEITSQNFDLLLYLSIAPAAVLDGIKKSIYKHFHIKHFEFRSFSLISKTVIKHLESGISDFVLVDANNVVTDVSVIKGGNLRESISFPSGTETFLKKAAEVMGAGQTNATVLSQLHLFLAGEMSPERSQVLLVALESAGRAWLDEMIAVLRESSEEAFLPKQVFLLAEPPFDSIFLKFLRNLKFSTFVEVGETFEVKLLDSKVLEKTYSESQNVHADLFLIIEAVQHSLIHRKS